MTAPRPAVPRDVCSWCHEAPDSPVGTCADPIHHEPNPGLQCLKGGCKRNIHRCEHQRPAVPQTATATQKIARFAAALIAEHHRSPASDIDGATFQDVAIRCGVLQWVRIENPDTDCGPGCVCAEVVRPWKPQDCLRIAADVQRVIDEAKTLSSGLPHGDPK